jgi:hydrogenase-4 membrane subunit HyfE
MSVETVLLGVTALAVVAVVVMGVLVVRVRRTEPVGSVDTSTLVEELKRSMSIRRTSCIPS